MENKISGNDILLFLDTSGTPPYTNYKTVVCLTTNGLTRATTAIDAKSKCGPDTLPGTQSNSVTFEGQIMSDPDSNHISEDALDDAWRDVTTVGFKMGKVAPGIGDVTYFGTGFISKLDDTFGDDAVGTFQAEISIYGLVNKTTATS